MDSKEMEKLQTNLDSLSLKQIRIPTSSHLYQGNSRKQNLLDDPIYEALTPSQTVLSDNDQTWLYYREGSNPNEVVDITEWLTIKYPVVNHRQSKLPEDGKKPEGGGIDSRTFLRPRKHSVNSYSSPTNKLTLCKTKVHNPYTTSNNEETKGASLLRFDGREPYLVNCTVITSPTGGTLSNGTSSKPLLNFTQDNSQIISKTESSVKQRASIDKFDFGINLNETISLLEDVSCPKFESISSGTLLSISDDAGLANSQFTPPQSTTEPEIEVKDDDSKVSKNNDTSPEENFKPKSMSTPTSSNYPPNKQPDDLNDSLVTDINCDEPELANATFVAKSLVLNRTWDARNNATLSKSDPSILDSVECGPKEILNSTYDRRENRKEQTFSQIKLQNAAYIGSEGDLNMGSSTYANVTVILGNEEDNVSSASDSSYCSSSNHIRSLGDVRTAARQQEESLRMQPLERKKIYSRSGIVRSQELVPKMKKVLSEDGIHTDSSESQRFMISRPNKAQGSLSNINNNNTLKLTGGFLRPPRFNTPRGLIQSSGTKVSMVGVRNQELCAPITSNVGNPIVGKKQPEISHQPVVTSKIPRSKIPTSQIGSKSGQSRIPTPNFRVQSTQGIPRGSWRDGCY